MNQVDSFPRYAWLCLPSLPRKWKAKLTP